jgi:hypothetical protein
LEAVRRHPYFKSGTVADSLVELLQKVGLSRRGDGTAGVQRLIPVDRCLRVDHGGRISLAEIMAARLQ